MALVASQRIALTDYATDLVRPSRISSIAHLDEATGNWLSQRFPTLRDFTPLPLERRWLATICAKSVAKITETIRGANRSLPCSISNTC
jgi:hypothetical protein